MTKDEYKEYLKTPHWKETRDKRLSLDGKRCYVCGYKHNLNVHHISYKNVGNEDVRKDLVTLCDMCHLMVHNIIDKVHVDYNDYKNIPVSPRNVHKKAFALKVLTNHCADEIVSEFCARESSTGGDLNIYKADSSMIAKMAKISNLICPDIRISDFAPNVATKVKEQLVKFQEAHKRKQKPKFYCVVCGKRIKKADKFCSRCGGQQPLNKKQNARPPVKYT